jgi:hypothetical protein
MTERVKGSLPDLKEWENKPSFQCAIYMGKHSVNIYSRLAHFLPYFENHDTDYISSFPGWKTSRQPSDSEFSIVYHPRSESAFYYKETIKTLLATGRPEDYESGQVLAYLGFWLMEAQRQKESMFTMHSSALTIEDAGVLLLGHSGSGKTSVLLGLNARYDCEIISNDLTIVEHNLQTEKMTLIDGTKEVRLRLASVRTNFPELISLFPQGDQPPWETKVAVTPEAIGMVSAIGPKRLNAAFLVHLDSQEHCPLLTHRTEGIDICYVLYEDMSRIVRGHAISLFGADNRIMGYTPSLDNQKLHKKRVAAIECLQRDIGVWNISGGSLNQVCEAIYRLSET